MPVSVQDQVFRVAIILSVMGVSALTWQYAVPSGTAARDILGVVFSFLYLPLFGCFVIDFLRRRRPSVQIPKRLKRGECPGCLYDLTGLHAERIETFERAFRCPECGAVWQAQRVGSMQEETRA